MGPGALSRSTPEALRAGLDALFAQPLTTLLERAAPDHEVHLVGGTVRDLWLGRAPGDVDVVCRDPRALAQALEAAAGGHHVVLDEDQPVLRWVVPRAFRRAIDYLDLAGLVGEDLHEDLLRRDLTVNAVALTLTGPARLIDPQEGLADLERAVIRARAREVLASDPLRVLRVYRFAASLGFPIAQQTRAWAQELAPALAGVSPERIRVEWLKAHQQGAAGLIPADVAERALPGLLDADGAPAVDEALATLRTGGAGAGWQPQALALLDGVSEWPLGLLRSAGRMSATGGALQRGLKAARFSRAEQRAVQAWLRGAALLGQDAPDPAELGDLWSGGASAICGAALLAWASDNSRGEALAGLLAHPMVDFGRAAPLLRGPDLMAAGVPRGPELGRAMRRCRGLQLLGRWSDRAAALSSLEAGWLGAGGVG